jgi:hypothetical protein
MEFTVESVAGRRIKKVRVERSISVLHDEAEEEPASDSRGNGNRNGGEKRRWIP